MNDDAPLSAASDVTPRRDLVAAVLAGGQSRRLGRDKASVDVAGRGSLARVVDVARPWVSEVLVVGGAGPGRVADVDPGGGPAQGLIAAFRARTGMSVLALACDMPLLPSALVAQLVAPLPSGCAARLAVVGGRIQPLCALYAPSAQPVFEAQWAAGQRALYRILAALPGLALMPLPRTVDPRRAADFDTQAELDALQRLAAPSPRTSPA